MKNLTNKKMDLIKVAEAAFKTGIEIKGEGVNKRFTVRKMSGNIGVERIFPMNSPFIDKVELLRQGKVRRARIYYLRNLTGKKARIKEKRG